MGIPISFMGAFWVMPHVDTSVNMMSLFGFILALGIVVGDAIVVGERVFSHESTDRNHREAAISGTAEVIVPVVFGVLSTIDFTRLS